MGTISKTRFFPWSTLFAGLVGFALRSWLYSDMQDSLLPADHPAGVLSFVLLALVLAACWFGVRKVVSCDNYAQLFPRSVAGGVGTLLAAVGFGLTAFGNRGIGIFPILIPILGVLAAIALAASGLFRLKGQKPFWLLHCVVAVYLMARTMSCCSAWSAQTQMQLYFFQLLACCFLMLATYYRVSICILGGRPGLYVFFSQAALFCCCLCCVGSDWLFYLSAGMWMAADYCLLPSPEQSEP